MVALHGHWHITATFALDKLIVAHFPHPRNGPTPKAPPLSLRDTTVKETESVCVLGVMLDSRLKWKVQQASALGKATSIVSALWQITRPSQGVSLKMICCLYISVVIPKMTYGLNVWYTPPHCPEGGQKRVGSVSALHRQALLSITGAMRSALTDLLETHANLLPMRYLLEKICYRSLIRIFSLPDNHPVRKMASNAYRHRNTTTHSPPLWTLSRLFDLPAPSDVETITPLAHPPDYDVLFSCDIPLDKDQAYRREENNRRRINIYSDGSRIDGQAGAAVVLLDKQNPANNQVLRYQLGALKLHTTYEAEGIGVVLRLALLQNCLHTNQDNTNMIGLDGKSFIEVTFNFKHRPRQYIIDEIHRLTDEILTDTSPRLLLTWVPGHMGLDRNECADEEAKRAACGNTGGSSPLPQFLRGKTLPASVSALKQHFHTSLIKRWENNFAKSRRLQRFSIYEPRGVHLNFVHLTDKLSRRQTSVLVQLHTGHIPLNFHLQHINRSNTPNCPNCEASGYLAKETV
ncbi:hypothetical protein D9758_016068 [Tetrapyrgos nigripes]|uniref:RNase H type-1 domain-containing protein n=1 Tax=Tetrapyrgos nigripes TaxID=182062 RepID=A0A8H5C330_9AGAR|nr:hypothetical protein D9758_016068 [Tetrapyrgos nigripes]